MLPSRRSGSADAVPGSERSCALGRSAAGVRPAQLPLRWSCASGTRAAIAASALRSRLPQPVLRVDGGVADVLAALVHEPAASLL